MKKIKKFIDYFFAGFSYLTSKRVIAILIMVFVFGLLNVSLGYREKLIKTEEELMLRKNDVIFEKGNPNISYSNEDVNIADYGNGMAITDYIDCYQKKIEQIPENVQNYINQLNNLYNENVQHYAFYYQDIFSGFTVSYNEDAPIFTASSIKGPAMIYLYEMASLGKVDLNEKLVYTGSFYSEGSGILKNKEINTSYTVEELIYYAIHYSDNIAYMMLMNRFNRSNILEFWTNLGTKHIFTQNTIWGITSAHDAAIYMKELYRFSKNDNTYGTKLMEYFKGADWKLITDKDGKYNTASKGGWAGTAIHDATIVFDENPYILVVMSNTGEANYPYLFNNTSKLVGALHEEYWKYKVETCKTIPQY